MEPSSERDKKKSDTEARQNERSEAFTRYRDDTHKRTTEKLKVPNAAASLQVRGLAGSSKISAENPVLPPTKLPPTNKSKEALELEIQKKKKVIGTIKLDTLPDRGKRLKEQLKELEDQLSVLSLSALSEQSAGSKDSSVMRHASTVSSQERVSTGAAAAPTPVAEKAVKEIRSNAIPEMSASKESKKTALAKCDSGERHLSKEDRTGRSISPSNGPKGHKSMIGPATPSSEARSGDKPSSAISRDLEKNCTDSICSGKQGLAPSEVTLTQRQSKKHDEAGDHRSEHKHGSDSSGVAVASRLSKELQNSKHPEQGVAGSSVVAKRRPVSPVARASSHHDEPRPQTSALHSVYERRVLLVSPLPLTKTSPPAAKGRGSAAETLGTRIPRGLSERCTARLQHFAQTLSSQPGEWDESPQPARVQTPLMPHQLQALRWMLWREEQEFPGGILADAMGLGKTLTMLSLVEQQRRKDKSWKLAVHSKDGGGDGDDNEATAASSPRAGTLVVCPLSLLHQWEEEVERHLPGQWRVRVHHGRNRSTDPEELVRCHLVITTYDTISSDWARVDATGNKGLSPLFAARWRRLVLDEAHSIRNLHTRRAKAACALLAWSHWALTGTPVHNDVADMRALLKFLQCRPFDDDAFWKQWVKENPGPEAMAVVMKCLLLRRTKEQVGKDGKPLVPLPKKSIVLHRLSLEGTEAKVYKELDEWSRSSGPEKYVDPVTGRELYRNTGSRRFVMLIRLQQACSHLALLKGLLMSVKEKYDTKRCFLGLQKVLEDAAVDTDELLSASMAGLQLADESAAGEDRLDALNLDRYAGAREFDSAYVSCKIRALLDMLIKVQEESNNQDKSVVVSRWTSLLSLVRQQLEKRGISCVTIQGSVPGQQRAAHVASFNNCEQGGPTVMLLSLEAGGVGLNLVGGNHMFVLDVHWNPALEAQAFDRIHRVGQTKTVVINRLICAGTIEERILELQKHKQQLAESVVGRRRLTAEDYAFLFATSS